VVLGLKNTGTTLPLQGLDYGNP